MGTRGDPATQEGATPSAHPQLAALTVLRTCLIFSFLCYLSKAKGKSHPKNHSVQQHYQLLSGFRHVKGLRGALQYQTRIDQLKKYEESSKIVIWETKGPPGVL